jgi:ferric-dicitrate binding protein FerR (iron transport regulator)
MNESKLISFIRGSASESEKKEIIAWIESSDKNRKQFNSLKNLWALSPPSEYFNQIYDPKILKRANKITGLARRRLITEISKYAAAFVLIILASSITFLLTRANIEHDLGSSWQTITCAPGQTSEVIFPDGSVATLNSGSSLSYSAKYSVKERSIKLEGEAMFDVKTNAEIPFTVEARGIVVRATGTSFNVDAYTSDREMNITLVSGIVQLSNSDGRFLSAMKAGENARIDMVANKLYISEVNTDYYVSWQKGIIMFSNKRLGDIALDMERWYNVSIIFSDPEMEDIRYSGAILKNKPVDQVLEILRLTSNFDYDISIKENKASIITIK